MTKTPNTMDADTTVELLLFGDLTASFDADLMRLLHISDDEALTSFFERVAFGLREELGRHPSAVQAMFPRFTTLIDLAARRGELEGAPVVRFCLMTVCQLAKFIHFAKDRPFPRPESTLLLGSCTGSFAASAVCVSQSVSDVVLAGVEATRVAFRTALRSLLQRSMVTTAGDASWSAAVSRSKPVEELVARAAEGGGPSRLYISAASPTSTTVSGPPELLEAFIAQHGLQAHRLSSIESPFHAAHLFGDEDVDFAVAGFPAADFARSRPRMPLLSGSDGRAVAASGLGGLLRAASAGVLREQVRWEPVMAATATALAELRADGCDIFPFYCNAASQLSSFLAHRTALRVAVQNAMPARAGPEAGPSGRFDRAKIAIVGYSGRYPEAASNDELWELLRAGRDVHREIPEDRFDWRAYHDASGKGRNTNRVKHGCFINEPGLFDTRFFNMSPREADSTDPAHRLAITATYEAMEMAGMVPNRTPSTQQDRIGVFFGVTSDDWREANSSQSVDTYFIPGGVRAFMPGRISYFFRFSGPSLSIDTACSSSFAAIQSACGYLLRGECDTAVAGGTNILTNPDIFTGLDRGHFLAGTGNCNTFDDEASGYCRAEGVGAVILKRLDDAVADGDPIFGVIAGANTNHCGQSESITRPHEGDQVSVFQRVMRYRGVDPNHISYVEMHGTGTQAGDATEMRSVLSVFVPEGKRTGRQPLYLGSAKANVGHSESASGVVSLIKVLLMMRHSEIPPHCGIKTRINRNYPTDLAERNVRIAREPTPWRREDSADGTRRVFLNNFSAAGGNTALLLEDAPERAGSGAGSGAGAGADADADARDTHLVAVTAKTATALAANMRALLAHLEANPGASLPALAYTTTARRIHHGFRAAVSGSSVTAVARELAQRIGADAAPPRAVPGPADVPGLAFLFTGQGGLYAGLGRELFRSVPGFRDDVLRFDAAARQLGFPSFVGLVDGSAPELDGVDTCASHLALTCVQMALCRLWAAWGVRPAVVAGHSLGEYAALFAAGVISASDAIFLVGTRASLLARACSPGTHAMLAVKAAADAVRPLLAASGCELTCRNHPQGTVAGGPRAAVDDLAARVKAQGCDAVVLDIPYSFHTAQVDAILADFEAAARAVHFRAPKVPVLSPLLARVVRDGDDGAVLNAQYLAKACRGVVDFQGALEAARVADVVGPRTLWLELGPHPACSAMVKATLGADSVTVASLRKSVSPWKTIVAGLEAMYLRGVPIDWNNYHRDFAACQHVVDLPRYRWDLKKHWIQYKNDWLLTKGVGETARPKGKPAVEAPPPRYISPSVQRVLEEKQGAAQSTLLVESDLFDSKLIHVLRGHQVNGASLCPSTLYADVAMTMAKTLVQGNAGVSFSGFDVCDMHIDKPLVALPSETSHLFRVSATADWPAQLISMSIYSVDAAGATTTNHATFNVRLTADKAAWLAEWKPMAYLIKGRIAALENGVVSGNCSHLKRNMVYKLFGSLVDYSSGYQGMQEVILDSDELEATAKVVLQTDDQGFVANPQWVDSLGHLAGFIMNGNENVQPDKQVYLNHGWSRLRLAEAPQQGKVYTTYNKMQLVSGKLYAGDTWILDGDRIVGVFDKVAFQGVPRKLLETFLPSKGAAKAPVVAAAPAAKAAMPAPAPAPAATPAPVPARTPARGSASAPPQLPAAAATTGDFGLVLNIIAEEVGIEAAELQPDSLFADFGLDSLLALTVAERIHDETGMDLPSTFFSAYPTVSDLQSLLDPGCGMSRDVPSLTSASSVSGDDDSLSGTVTSASSVLSDSEIKGVIRQTIADETGTPADELTSSTCLADIGVDSLLGLTIADCLTEALGTEVNSSVLLENETLERIEATVRKILGISTDSSKRGPVAAAAPAAPAAAAAPAPSTGAADGVVAEAPHATSIVLQRAKKSQGPGRAVFLLPDGSGSAASYGALDRLDPGTTVYGINCPWRTNPEEMMRLGVTTDQVVSKFTAEIRRLQPHGPYLLGGWSAGGIFAFEAARKLMAAGEAVEKLLLIDAPNPIGLENPPSRMFDFFESAGVFGNMIGNKTVPGWLRHHFDATVAMLDGYVPRPLAGAPPTAVIYARDGICKDASAPQMAMSADDPREMLWLLRNRSDFSASGWASLLGAGSISVEVVDDVNHFTMMNPGPHMASMCGFVRRSLLGL